jgi:hypothetical protein
VSAGVEVLFVQPVSRSQVGFGWAARVWEAGSLRIGMRLSAGHRMCSPARFAFSRVCLFLGNSKNRHMPRKLEKQKVFNLVNKNYHSNNEKTKRIVQIG